MFNFFLKNVHKSNKYVSLTQPISQSELCTFSKVCSTLVRQNDYQMESENDYRSEFFFFQFKKLILKLDIN